MRLFVGMPVPGHDALGALGPGLEAVGARVVPPGSWHVTLRFLGDAEPDEVLSALDDALAGAVGCSGRVAGLGAFSSPGKARILWAGVEAPCVREIARRVVDATRDLGTPPDERDFRPHVTLARARRPVDARALVARHKDTVFGRGPLDEVVLYASALTAEGPAYEALRTWQLATA